MACGLHRDSLTPQMTSSKRLLFAVLLVASPIVAECQDPQQAQVDRGRELYDRTCAVCHGSNGEGYVADRAPQLSNQEFLASVTDPFLVRAIDRGRPGTTMSAFGMAFGGPFKSADELAIVSYMRTWLKVPVATLDERPLAGDATKGATVYGQQCEKCHGTMGQKGPYLALANPELLASASNGFLRWGIAHGRPNTPMEDFAALGSQTTDDVVAALRSWQQAVTTPDGGPPPPVLGPVILHPNGPDPLGFVLFPGYTPVDVVKAQYDANARFGILDARAPGDYATEHIAGAVNVPYYDPAPFIPQLPTSAWLVCYCACPHAESGALAQKLLDAGFKQVAVIDEGFPAWQSRGYPTHTGAMP
jgi:mono/diheme cytochrome c family protein/rhodanese-related sulfurtransferase